MWKKIGLVFAPDTALPWSISHAQVPTVDVIDSSRWRIYYSSRDINGISRISFFDVEAGNPTNIIYKHPAPIIDLGRPGCFDDSGMMPSSIACFNGIKYLYYTGWNKRVSVPYHNSIGIISITNDDTTFTRLGEGPVMGITLNEPHFIGTSTVIYDKQIFRNWYAACTGWDLVDGKYEPRYHLKYAESDDGVNWIRNGLVSIDYKNINEGGLVRASVLVMNSSYHMWYSRRNLKGFRTNREDSYRIGYARSSDGLVWNRLDDRVGIDVSSCGWDSQMIAYPYVVEYKDCIFLFYNGNVFGKTGIGVAVRSKLSIS